MVRMTTSLGEITIEVDEAKAPISARNFLQYVKDGYYNGTIFHRVIPGFMVQGGGLTEDMEDKREGQRAPIKNESSNGLKNEIGTLAMARTSMPDSATAQFFINVANNAFLDKDRCQDGVGYAVFGRVTAGMDVVKKIVAVPTGRSGHHQDVPREPIFIETMEVV